MTTAYSEWVTMRRAKSKARVHWICGLEDVLRESVLEDVKAKSCSDPDDRVYLDATGGPRAVWDALAGVSYLDRPRLVVVRHAERLTRDLGPLGAWLASARKHPRTWVAFVALEDDWPTDRMSEVRKASQLVIVRCGAVPADRLPLCVLDWLPGVTPTVAAAIVVRAGGDLFVMRQICRRLAVLGGPWDLASVEAAWSETPGSAYLRYVLAGRRDKAATAARMVEDPASVLRLLEWSLVTMAKINRARSRGIALQDVRAAESLGHGIVERYADSAVAYDIARVRKDTALLAHSYRHLEAGRLGVLEVLAMLW